MISEDGRKRADYLCSVMKGISGLDPKVKSRCSDVVSVRCMVACQLMKEGMTSLDVAELFGKTHPTILYYKWRFLSFFSPGWEQEHELWEKFKKAI